MATVNGLVSSEQIILPFRLRAVRIGIQATLLAIVVLAVYPLLPGAREIQAGLYYGVLVVAALGVGGVAMLPWPRMLAHPRGIWFMYAWSAADIVLITLGVAASGGSRSQWFFVYALTTIFFAASYPPRGQWGLLLFTCGCYLLVVALTGWGMGPAALFLRLTILGVLAFIGSFMSRELMESMMGHAEAHTESERRAASMTTVAGAARSVNTLTADEVLPEVVRCAVGLGFDMGSIAFLDEERAVFRIAYSVGLPDIQGAEYPITWGLTGVVRREGTSAVAQDYAGLAEANPDMVKAGIKSGIASPIWLDGRLEAVLLAGNLQARSLSYFEVEAFELLAALAGRALENARRFEEQRRTVERLSELDRLKSDFISNVSHELRTPLTVVQGAGLTLERLEGRISDESRRDLMGRMNDNARALSRVIDTLLDFARMEAGRLELNPGILNLGELVERVTGRLSSLLSSNQLSIDLQDGLEVHADPHLMERVIENLLSNAAKHAPGSAVVVSAKAEGQAAAVSVTDRGPGIPEAELAHIGERFFRGGDPDKRTTRGMGLGLALVKEILRMHGSELEIRSRPAEGSTFTFRLPLLPPQNGRAAARITQPAVRGRD